MHTTTQRYKIRITSYNKGVINIFARKEFTAQDIEFILGEYHRGTSLKEIGKLFNCTRKPIKRIILENGGSIRSNCCRKYSLNSNYFDFIDTPNKAYILGFIYADGSNCVDDNKWMYHWQLTLKSNDIDILRSICSEICYDGPIKIESRMDKGCLREYARLIICDKHMCKQLSNLGVVPNKTHVVSFPSWLDENLFPHFIRGVFDGDGCIDTKGHASIAGAKNFIFAIAEILKSKCDLVYNLYECKQALTTWQCHLSGKTNAKLFLDWIYCNADLKLERKYQRYIDAYFSNSNVNVAKAEKSA